MYDCVLRTFQVSACVLPGVLLFFDAPFGRFAVQSRWNWHGACTFLYQAMRLGWPWNSSHR